MSERGWTAETLDELRSLYEPLRRYAAVVARWDVDPDDLLQEAFTRLFMVPAGNVRDRRAYLRQTIVNLAMNERRRLRRAAAATNKAANNGHVPDDYPSDLSDVMQLEPRVRGLLYLVEVEGEPINDAAEAVGMSAAAGRMALSRARRRLRDVVSEEIHGE